MVHTDECYNRSHNLRCSDLYKNILLTVDLEHPKSQKKSLPAAIELCQQHNAVLHVIYVVPDFGMSIVSQYFPKGYEKDVAKAVLEQLKTYTRKNIPEGIKVKHIVGNGNVYEAILKVADKVKTDLVVLQAGKTELQRFLLGPNAARVVRHAKCSVLVVR